MPYKICPYCGKTSYSAAESPSIEWLCPTATKIFRMPSLTSVPRKEKEEEEK